VFFANSGAEAMECAIKITRKYHAAKGNPERYHIITFDGAFHGRTLATLAATGCTAGSVTLGPAVVARDATYETLGDVSVVVTTAGSCPLGLWAGVLTTSDPSGPAVTAALAQSAPGTYTGTLFDPIQPWDLGIHTVEVFSGAPVTPLPSSPTATAVLCVTSGASTC